MHQALVGGGREVLALLAVRYTKEEVVLMADLNIGDKVAAAVMSDHRAEMRRGVIIRINPPTRNMGVRYTIRMENGTTSVVAAGRTVRLQADDFHTMDELYEFRMLLTAHLFHEWDFQQKHPVSKSRLHSDGSQAGGGEGWFIVVATLPTGQISFYYPDKFWELFDIPEEIPPAFDGHDQQDVAARLLAGL